MTTASSGACQCAEAFSYNRARPTPMALVRPESLKAGRLPVGPIIRTGAVNMLR